jgi:cell division protein FtsL
MALPKNKYLKPFKNIFILILAVFAIWMLFFDANSWLIHHELNTEIEDLENEKEYYKKEIEKDKKDLKKLSTKEGLEKFLEKNIT